MVQEQFADQVEIVGIGGSDPDAGRMNRFVESTGVDGFTHIFDLENAIWDRYEIRTQPTFVFIDDDGSTETTRGLGLDGLTERIEVLLAT